MRNTFFVLLILSILISTLGILSIYSATHDKPGRLWQDIYKRQLLWVSLGLSMFLIISHFNYRRIWDWIYPLYGLSVLFLAMVFLLGITRLGAQRWLKIGWFNFQPTELTKLVMIIVLAGYFSRKSPDNISLLVKRMNLWQGLILPFILVAIPVGLILEQPDLGSAVMLIFIFICIIYLSEVRLRYIIIFLLTLLALTPFFWYFLRDYQKERVIVFLNPNIDPLGAGYTIIQSKIAIGSGGLFGKGWLSGTQSQLHFLPESHTDFIFASFTEEWGFLGAIFLLGLYYLLIWQGILVSQRTTDPFGRLICLGISLSLAFQVAINIAMNLGLAPVVGLPLPLMSYGGSSVLVTFISLGLLVNIDKTKNIF
ncbi:MAG: rod shape-determining protein RodA [Candidatus Omnitrophica bacterium]|nr:rod shape-determining protein RodA [Candidatus Omnitrophota bacterium]